jgi:hypothetical protein
VRDAQRSFYEEAGLADRATYLVNYFRSPACPSPASIAQMGGAGLRFFAIELAQLNSRRDQTTAFCRVVAQESG